LSLISSEIYDIVRGVIDWKMERKSGKSQLDGTKTELFEYARESSEVTTIAAEFKVVDFLSVLLVAADAISRNNTRPMDLSMLRDRSVTRVILKVGGQQTIHGHSGIEVRVAPPDNPSGAIGYVIACTNDGSYYPTRISIETGNGTVTLEGRPQ
jgi:hypothetical protein